MQSNLLSHWLAHYDPIHLGWTPRGIANAVCATSGWCFPRMGGGYNLYRGTPAASDIDYTRPVGAAGPQARTVANFAWRPHAASTGYFYALRAVGGGGVESATAEPAVPVAFDAAGALIGARCNSPADLRASPAAEGRFRLRWIYSPMGEAVPPLEFRVYSDGGTGVVNYDTPIGVIPFVRRRFHHEFTTAPHAHGARRRFAVRAVSVEGQHDGNSAWVEGLADALGPPSPVLIGECVEV